MIYGDSNSFRPDGAKKSWPGILQRKSRSHLRVFNESCDGRTIGRDSCQYNGLADIRFRLKAYKFLDYIMIMLGTNDFKAKYGPATPSEIIKDIGNLIDIVESYGGNIKPILLTPPPMGIVITGQLAGAHSKVKHLAAECRELAIKRCVPLVDIYSILHIPADFEDDMIHINSIGRLKVANAAWSEILVQSTSQ
jgi:lysophospholipase L1-like esterase